MCSHALSRLALGTAILASTACRRAPNDAPSPERGGVVGPSTAFAPQITQANAARARLRYRLRAPANVTLLMVRPGRAVTPVAFGTTHAGKGSHEVNVEPFRHGASQIASDAQILATDLASEERGAFDQCMLTTIRPQPASRPREVRDSSGKVIATVQPNIEREREVERANERAAGEYCRNRIARATTGDQRAEARYLLLVASDTPLTPRQLLDRLAVLNVTTDDIPSAMSAIAEGLFVDKRAAWAAAYRRW